MSVSFVEFSVRLLVKVISELAAPGIAYANQRRKNKNDEVYQKTTAAARAAPTCSNRQPAHSAAALHPSRRRAARPTSARSACPRERAPSLTILFLPAETRPAAVLHGWVPVHDDRPPGKVERKKPTPIGPGHAAVLGREAEKPDRRPWDHPARNRRSRGCTKTTSPVRVPRPNWPSAPRTPCGSSRHQFDRGTSRCPRAAQRAWMPHPGCSGEIRANAVHWTISGSKTEGRLSVSGPRAVAIADVPHVPIGTIFYITLLGGSNDLVARSA